MKKIMHILFLSCLKASELIEKKFHFNLTLTEKIRLKFHKMLCDACTCYEKQSILIDKGIASMQKNENTKSHDHSEQLIKRITQKLIENNK